MDAFARVKHDGPGLPFRWPWLEVVTAVALVVVYAAAPAPPWFLLALLLAAIAGTDFYCKLIPDRITFPGVALGVVVSAIWPAGITSLVGHHDLLRGFGLHASMGGAITLSLLGAAAGFLVAYWSKRNRCGET